MSERIEKILARELNEPRSRVKTLLQKGQVTVDGVVAPDSRQTRTPKRFAWQANPLPAGLLCI